MKLSVHNENKHQILGRVYFLGGVKRRGYGENFKCVLITLELNLSSGSMDVHCIYPFLLFVMPERNENA